jgi:hypothetical protein
MLVSHCGIFIEASIGMFMLMSAVVCSKSFSCGQWVLIGDNAHVIAKVTRIDKGTITLRTDYLMVIYDTCNVTALQTNRA